MSVTGSARLAASLARLDELAERRGIALERDRPLAPYTTLRVGGPADRLVSPRDAASLREALRLARDAGVPWFILGNGSDLVVADAGIRGLVVRNRAREVNLEGAEIEADAGAPMAMLVKLATEHGLAGLEFGISIPGTLGGAIWANAGAHGGEIAERLVAVTVWDPSDGREHDLAPDACRFAYRESRFKHSAEVILQARLRLEPDDAGQIAARVVGNQADRQATQPLADQNAGSVFRNPPGDYAGRLVDAAGLKALRIGSAAVSTLHANFIISDRGGNAADVRRLADHVRSVVRDTFGVELEFEIEFVGDWGEPA